MVFESIVADLLNRYLGEYVENLDKGQLKIGIWGGDVVLKNLILKQSALKELDLPVHTIYGHLGSLILKIPWKNLYSAPVEAYIDRLFLVAVPNSSVKFDADKEEKAAVETKKSELERIQLAKKIEQDKDLPKADKTFSEKLSTQIINNVQIKISEIHIRYEDNTSCSSPFACGITLNNFSVFTTDGNWKKQLVSTATNENFKIAILESLAVYMNCNGKLFQHSPQSEYDHLFKASIASKENVPYGYDYILGPITSTARLKMNPDPTLNDFSIPKFCLNVIMEKLSLALTKTQYQDSMQLIEQFGRMSRATPYRRYRPVGIPYKGHYREWWKFAYQCILKTEVQRKKLNWSWDHMKETRELCRLYEKNYKQKLLAKKLTHEISDVVDSCEKKLNLQNLVIVRQKVELEVEKEAKIVKDAGGGGWFGGWWGSKKGDSESDKDNIKKKFQEAMTPEEKEKLFKAIGYQENFEQAALPESFVDMTLQFSLNCLEVSIKSDVEHRSKMENVMLLQLNQVQCDVSQRPSAKSIKLNLNMRELSVYGLQREQYLPVIIQSQIESSDLLLDVMFESNPLDHKCDQRVKVQSQPIQIIYNSRTIIELVKVFKTQQTMTLTQLQDAAAEQLVGIKERSAIGLQHAITSHPRLEVDISLAPSYFIIPDGGEYTKNESLLVLSLGQLVLKTEPRPLAHKSVKSMHGEGANSEEILQELIRQSYDKFTFEIQSIQILVAKSTEDWECALSSLYATELHILEPSFVKLSASISVITDDPRLPKCKIACELPSINVSVTEDRFLEMMSILVTLPLPVDDDPVVLKPITKESSIIGSSLSLLKFLDDKQQKYQKKKKQPVDPIDSTDGVVQFTDLEVYFLLGEFSFSICKSGENKTIKVRYESSSDEFGTPDEQLFNPESIISPSFKSVQFEELGKPRDLERMVCVKVKKLEMRAAQMTYELNVNLRLGAVSFDQFRVRNEQEQIIKVIDTPRDVSSFEYLFSLNYTNCKKTSPEFITKYHSCEQTICIQISKIVLRLNQEGIGELIVLMDGLQSHVNEIMEKNSKPRDRIVDAGEQTILEVARERLPIILEEADDEEGVCNVETKISPKKQKIVDSIKLQVNMQMEDVTVQIENDIRPIAALEVKNMTCNVVLKSSYTDVLIKLENVLLTDSNPMTIHPKILSIVGGDALKVQLIIFNLDQTSEYNSDNMKIDVTMGCANIVFLNWFVASLLSFLDHFQTAQERIKEASKAAAESARQNVVAAYTEQTTRIKMNVKIKAPIIFVPVHSQSLEAIMIDLGHLTVTNTILNVNVPSADKIAVLDDIKVQLTNVQLSRALLKRPSDRFPDVSIVSELGSSDNFYEFISDAHLLSPTSFEVIIRRNLSSNWCREIPQFEITGQIGSVELSVATEDYQIVMQILEKNMSEGQNEFKKPRKGKITSPDAKKSVLAVIDDDEARQQWKNTQDKLLTSRQPFGLDISTLKTPCDEDKNDIIDVIMKFSFHIDSIILNLSTAKNEGLACFGLHYLSLNGQSFADSSMNVSVLLCDINLDDTRPGREGKITRFLERRDKVATDQNISSSKADAVKSMIDVTLRMNGNNIFADVKVFSFNLILSSDFLLKLSSFLQPQKEDDQNSEYVIETSRNDYRHRRSIDAGSQQKSSSTMTLLFNVEEYDIILVEKMDDVNCLALILNNEISAKVRIIDDRQIIQGEIRNLSMFLSDFNPLQRNATKHYVLHPCSLSLSGSTPEDKGLHISINASKIKISVSPAMIELMSKIMATITQQESSNKNVKPDVPEFENLWETSKFEENSFWFLEAEEGLDVLSMDSLSTTSQAKEELCLIDFPSIELVMENGICVHTIPLLLIRTSMEAEISNWSSKMAISSSLKLAMYYYNNIFACWEPLIDLVEHLNSQGLSEFHPWELNFSLEIDKHEEDPEMEDQDPTTIIKIKSIETLELVITKTSLEVLKNLSESFTQAIDKEGLKKTGIIDAPYILKNETGLEIQLELERSEFKYHSANFQNRELNEFVIFSQTSAAQNEEVSSCIIYPGGKVFLELKGGKNEEFSNLDMQEGAQVSQEKFISLFIPEAQKRLQLPIHRADKRYFPIYRDSNQDALGLISEIFIDMGSTIVTIRGILQVFNHFTVPIQVYSNMNGRFVEIGSVAPNEFFNVPLANIHSANKDLHFSILGYRTSTQGINWKENSANSNLVKSIQCDPVNSFEPLYVNAIREKFAVFSEISSKYTFSSACYVIRLRPPLLLRNALPINISVSVAGSSATNEKRLEAGINNDSFSSVILSSSGIAGEDILEHGEKIIKPGELLHLPTVKLQSKHNESMYIVLRLSQYLDRDWSVKTEIPSNPPEFGVWTFYSYDSAEVISLQLGVRFENLNNGLNMTVYCPFWMINKTGLYLSYRADENTNLLYHPPEYEGAILFSFREKAFFGKKKASVRVESGEWSEKFSIDVAGSSGVIECKSSNMIYQIGVQNILTSNSLTKQIVFTPYYIIVNRGIFDIEVQEYQRPADARINVKSNECVPWWPKSESCRMLRAKIINTDEVSAPFKYDEVQCSLLRLNNKYGGVNVDVHVTEGVIYITFTEYHPGDAPGLIMNFTDEDISFWEKGNVNMTTLQAREMIYYTWCDPAGERVITWKNIGKENIENDLRKDGVDQFIADSDKTISSSKQGSFRRQSSQKQNIFWVSFLNGTQRVLLFTKNASIANNTQSSSRLDQITKDVEIQLKGLGLSLVNNVRKCDLMYIGIASSSVTWEQEKNGRFKPLKIELNQLVEERYQLYRRESIDPSKIFKKYLVSSNGMYEVDFANNVIQKHTTQRRLRRQFYPGFWLDMKSSSYQLQLHAKINRIQIDNQLTDSIFPIILAPVPPPKSVAATAELKPFIEMSVVQRIIPHSTVKQFKYLRVLMQEFHVKVDLDFINALMTLFDTEISESEAKRKFEEDLDVQQQPLFAHVTEHSMQEQKNFYDNLHLGPLKIHISFSMGTGDDSDSKALPGIVSTILQGVGVTLTDINDVVFRLAFFEREFQFLTQRQLISECQTHYTGQAVKQLYVLVLGLDVIGNPYGLVVGITKGVEDLFYEPFQGLIQGPGEFAEGLVLGVRSLFGHTVGGAAGAVSKITGAVGKGLATLTFDKDYQRKRQNALNKKPTSVQEGLARGGKGVVMGVFDGITGVVTKPVQGARSDGVQGFFKGIGKGAIGLVARPTAGIVDFASGTLDSVKRATELSDEEKKLRPSRFFHSDGIIRPYSKHEAEGYKIFREVDKGKYLSSDEFVYSEPLLEKEIFLVTNHRVIYVVKNDMFGGWQTEWSYKWSELSSLRNVERGLEMTLEAPKHKSSFGKMFSSSDKLKKILLIENKKRCEKLLSVMTSILLKEKS